MSIKLDGKQFSLKIQERLTKTISESLLGAKRPPCLAVIRIGDDPASGVYISNKERACAKVGIKSLVYHLKENVSYKEVEQLIYQLNADNDLDGILLQLPLPKDLNAQKLISQINPSKDVDGLHETNIGKLIKSEPGLRSCTPAGIINLLNFKNIKIDGKRVVVIGRSLLVGKPI